MTDNICISGSGRLHLSLEGWGLEWGGVREDSDVS